MENKIVKDIKQLSNQKKFLFGILTIEKMINNYQYFSTSENWGSTNKIEKIVNRLYKIVLNWNKKSIYKISNIFEELEKNCPDLDSFEDSASYAFDLCTGIEALLKFIQTEDTSDIIDASNQAIATVDMYIQEIKDTKPNDENLEETISNHPLMKAEINRQVELINRILLIENLSKSELMNLRQINEEYTDITDLGLLFG